MSKKKKKKRTIRHPNKFSPPPLSPWKIFLLSTEREKSSSRTNKTKNDPPKCNKYKYLFLKKRNKYFQDQRIIQDSSRRARFRSIWRNNNTVHRLDRHLACRRKGGMFDAWVNDEWWRAQVIVDGQRKGRGWPVCCPFVPSRRAMTKKL